MWDSLGSFRERTKASFTPRKHLAPLVMHSYSDEVKFLLLPANGSERHGQRKASDVIMSPQNLRLHESGIRPFML